MFKKMMWVSMVCGLCLCGIIYCEDAATTAKDANALKVQIAKMRGRLLYKKSQIRKLEKEACAANPELKKKIEQLEKERRTQYIAANGKLEELYAEQDTLDAEIQKLTEEQETAKKK